MDRMAILNAEFANLRRRARIGVRVLLAGLGLEIVVLLIFAKDKPWPETAGLILAAAIVLFGVWIEYSSHNKAEDVADNLQQVADRELANASKEAAASMERAAQAEARAAEANQKAEEARLETERVRLEFAKYREDRKLDAKQIERIAGKLTQFSGVQFDVGTSARDEEYLALAEHIETTLAKARWTQIAFRGSEGVGFTLDRPGRPRIGTSVTAIGFVVGISRPEAEIQEIAKAGMALAAALVEEGIEARTEIVPAVPSPNENAIHIRIGRKT
jgi:hypothetical protein